MQCNIDDSAISWLKKQDLSFYADMLDVMQHKTAKAYLADDNGILIKINNKVWEFGCLDNGFAKKAVEYYKNKSSKNDSLCIRGNFVMDDVLSALNLKKDGVTECFLYTKFSDQLFKINTDIEIKPLTQDQAPLVASTYTLINFFDDKLGFAKKHIGMGMLGAFKENQCIGYIGTHEEGTMGMLEILPQYRCNGYGMALEMALANQFIKQGRYPYCHVIVSNKKSCALQEKMGFTSSGKNHLFWMS